MAKAKKKPVTVAKKITKPAAKAAIISKTSKPVKSVKAAHKTEIKGSSSKDTLKHLDKPLTRTQQIVYLADAVNLTKKNVADVMNSFEHMITQHLKNLGEISIGGLMKLLVIKKPATKAREGVNPFTGEPTVFKAKPAKKIVKIRALKKVKDMVI